VIEQILPTGVASAELFGEPPALIAYPGEEALIARAVTKRRTDFLGARHCARIALEELGERPVPILKGGTGEPLWPRGIVGSMTHCDGYRAAALAHSLGVRSIGIDAEPHGPLPDGVLDSVSVSAERDWLASNTSGLHLDRLLFCAKESTYKAWFPLTGRWLGFEDAHITFTVDGTGGAASGDLRAVASGVVSSDLRAVASGTFHSELLVPGNTHDGPALTSFGGRWLIGGGLVLTTITVL
jgi:4'-phosphopantetheinyl transferase EntD